MLLLVLCALGSQAFAWGSQGHQVIANVAWSALTPKSRDEVSRLLALEPGQTLESIATWADEHRSPATSAWHYVNFPRNSCQYEPERDCAGGQCVVGAVEKNIAVLASNADDGVRLKALKYLVHFIGDVHQPLHAGYKDDRGGNTYSLRAFMRQSNLHSVWDSGLISQLDLDNQALTRIVQRHVVSKEAREISVIGMAEESCRLVASPGFYPEERVTPEYVQRFMPVMQKRLSSAGYRLATVLNRALQ
ncbi:MAG: S1/P1 nuclease [Comamonadaceae bacterium]